MISIGIDLDCTLNNLIDEWISRYNADYNDNLAMPTKWDFSDKVKPECGKKIYEYLHEPGFFYNLNIQKDATEVLKWLYDNYDVYIVTAYTSDVCHDKTEWVKKYLPFFDVEKILFCNKKGLLNIDYLIDDGPHNIKDFKQVGIIYDYPYNQDLDPLKYPNRVHNWAEIKKFFQNNKDSLNQNIIYTKRKLQRDLIKLCP